MSSPLRPQLQAGLKLRVNIDATPGELLNEMRKQLSRLGTGTKEVVTGCKLVHSYTARKLPVLVLFEILIVNRRRVYMQYKDILRQNWKYNLNDMFTAYGTYIRKPNKIHVDFYN
jgi:hypothetical protein